MLKQTMIFKFEVKRLPESIAAATYAAVNI